MSSDQKREKKSFEFSNVSGPPETEDGEIYSLGKNADSFTIPWGMSGKGFSSNFF